MSRKRVVVTGLSALTPLGGNVTETWDNLLAGKSGIGPITLFDASGFDSRIAGEVKGFDPEAYGVPAKQARRMDRFVQFAVAAGNMLVEHSGLVINDDNAGRVSVILGVGLGGLHTIEVFHSRLVEAGPGKVSPFMIPMLISNMAPGQLAIATGAKGANMVLTSACASGTHAIGAAYTEIVMGRCDACISGGVEAVFSVLALHTGYVPGTINYETPDPECDLNCMTDGAKKLDPQYALSNSFGFGGTNGSILFKKFTA